MKCHTVVIFCSVIAVMSLVGISILSGNSGFTSYFVSSENMDAIRFNPMYIFGALGLVAFTCLAARIFFRRYDTQN